MGVFPAIFVFAELVARRSIDLSGARYYWAFAFRGSWLNIGMSLGYIAIFVVLTAGLLRLTRKSLFT
ncbi:hypothetical protein HT136_23100 [Novosphingobium profundi]|nr:hypothetical protein [Novosphingobium profundi]MBT0671263.1 hypothetical protein [Novosphingobium profundi]